MMILPRQQASRAMQESLRNLTDALRCSLCQGVYREPMTLSCSHSFCRECIDTHAADSWQCPCECETFGATALAQERKGIPHNRGTYSHSAILVSNFCTTIDPGCARSYSMQVSGSFRKINPALVTLVSSLEAMVDTLQRAPPQWWKEGAGDNDVTHDHAMLYPDHLDDEPDDDDDESIDLQKPRPKMPADEEEDEGTTTDADAASMESEDERSGV